MAFDFTLPTIPNIKEESRYIREIENAKVHTFNFRDFTIRRGMARHHEEVTLRGFHCVDCSGFEGFVSDPFFIKLGIKPDISLEGKRIKVVVTIE